MLPHVAAIYYAHHGLYHVPEMISHYSQVHTFKKFSGQGKKYYNCKQCQVFIDVDDMTIVTAKHSGTKSKYTLGSAKSLHDIENLKISW